MNFISKNRALLGLIIIAFFVATYSFITYDPLSESELTILKGKLREKPFLGEQGGDMPYYVINIRLIGSDRRYDLIDCAFDMSRSQEILNFKPKDSVVLYVREDNSNRLKVYQLKKGGEFFLSLSDYNKCYTNKWKLLIPIFCILISIFFYRLIPIGRFRNK